MFMSGLNWYRRIKMVSSLPLLSNELKKILPVKENPNRKKT